MNWLNARQLPEAIQWYEGMLLAPQHFQQLSLRGEMLLQYHAQHISPFNYGVRTVNFDALLLFSGVLRITDLEAIMPDGLIVYHPHPAADSLDLDLAPYLDEIKQKPLTIMLAVPARKQGSSIVKGDLVRYDSIEGPAISDENTGEGEVEIPRLAPKITLLAGEVSPQKYVSFPIAKVQYKNDSYSLTEFIPPQLNVPLQSQLGALCSTIAKRLREKASNLSEKVRSHAVPSTSNVMVQSRSLIQALVEGLPYLEAVLNTGVSSPYQIYLALSLVCGHIATLGSGLVPPQFPPYNHNDLLGSFQPLQEFIERMIKEGILESHHAVYFNNDPSGFSIKLESEWLDLPLTIGVREQAGMTERDIISWVDGAIIASHSKVGSLREKRVLGIARQRTERDEDLLPPNGVTLFSLKVDRALMNPDEMLEILNTAERTVDDRPLEIILYVRKKK